MARFCIAALSGLALVVWASRAHAGVGNPQTASGEPQSRPSQTRPGCERWRHAGVGDPQIRTDHPYYPGELAYSTLRRTIESALAVNWGLGLTNSTRDQALKLWLWRITHTIHDYSPRRFNAIHDYFRRRYGDQHSRQHPIRPDPKLESHAADDIDRDVLRWQFSYGYGLCGTLHATMGPLVEALAEVTGKDYRSRVVGIPGDSNHELFYDGKWRLFDVNMAGLVFDGNDPATADLVGFKDLFGPKGGPKRAELLDNAPRFNGRYLPVWTWAPARGNVTVDYLYIKKIIEDPKHFWNSDRVGQRRHGHLLYQVAYQACPVKYHLKRGESFTRWFRPEGLQRQLNAPYLLWWGSNLQGGPGRVRWWGHYLKDDTSLVADAVFGKLELPRDRPTNNRFSRHDPKKPIHSNGLFRWQPDLAAGQHLDGLIQADASVAYQAASPRLYARGPGKIVLGFFSPYTIAAMPADNTDPAKHGASLGAVIVADAVGQVPLELSTNCGAGWRRIGLLTGQAAKIDFTDHVKGRNQYWLRFGLDRSQGLDSLTLQTAVVICPAVYPKLKSGGTRITYRASGLGVVEVSPDFASEQLARYEGYFVGVENLSYSGYAASDRVAWRFGSGTASCIYKISAPAGRKLRSVSAAAAVRVFSPAQAGSWARIWVATSPHGPWKLLGRYDPLEQDCADINQASRVWVYGQADLPAPGANTAYVKVEMSNAGRPGGLRFLHMYGSYDVGSPAGLEITYYWTEAGQPKHYRHVVPAGADRDSFLVPTGQQVANEKVILAVLKP